VCTHRQYGRIRRETEEEEQLFVIGSREGCHPAVRLSIWPNRNAAGATAGTDEGDRPSCRAPIALDFRTLSSVLTQPINYNKTH
jgi:hypothetical protein